MSKVECFENPYDTFRLKVGFAGILLLLLFFSVTSMIDWRWDAFVLGFALTTIFTIALLYSELLSRPKAIKVIDDGIHLEYRARKPLFVPWHSIEWVDSVEVNQSTLKGKDTFEGRMKIKAKFLPMLLTYEVAHVVQSKYAERIGIYPPISPALAHRKENETRRRTT